MWYFNSSRKEYLEWCNSVDYIYKINGKAPLDGLEFKDIQQGRMACDEISRLYAIESRLDYELQIINANISKLKSLPHSHEKSVRHEIDECNRVRSALVRIKESVDPSLKYRELARRWGLYNVSPRSATNDTLTGEELKLLMSWMIGIIEPHRNEPRSDEFNISTGWYRPEMATVVKYLNEEKWAVPLIDAAIEYREDCEALELARLWSKNPLLLDKNDISKLMEWTLMIIDDENNSYEGYCDAPTLAVKEKIGDEPWVGELISAAESYLKCL